MKPPGKKIPAMPTDPIRRAFWMRVLRMVGAGLLPGQRADACLVCGGAGLAIRCPMCERDWAGKKK